MIYADFESILVQKVMESKIQTSLTLTDIKNMLLVVIFINQYVLVINLVGLLNYFNKELAMTKEDNKYFESPTKCRTCDDDYIDGDAKGRDHYHINGKCRGFAIELVIYMLN